MDHEVLKEVEKALEGNKTLQKLKLNDANYDFVPLINEFVWCLMIGIRLNTSLSEVYLRFLPHSWDCPIDGRLVYVHHMLCDSVGCSV